jgi:heme/copper-type cytochrome/quinol oxidase subunit 2
MAAIFSFGWLSGFIVPVVVALVLGLARSRFRPSDSSERITDAEREEFQSVNWFVSTAMFAVMALFAFTTYNILRAANQYFADAEGPAQFQLLPSNVIWMFLPGFGALALSWEITLQVWSLFAGKKRVEHYVSWYHERAGFNSTRILRWMALLIVLPIGIATILAVPMHSTLNESEIYVRSYASITPLRLPYADARRLTVVQGLRDRNGKFTARAEILIDFANGYRWHSESNRDFSPAVDASLLKFLEQKTGLPASEVETERDLNPI